MNSPRTQTLIKLWKWSAILLTILVVAVVLFKKKPPVKKQQTPTIIKEKKETLPQTVDASKVDPETLMTPEALVKAGENIIFMTDDPQLNERGRFPVGKGQCAFCHLFAEEQKAARCPDLRNIEARSHERIKEARYAAFSKQYAETPEPVSQLKPKAATGGEYLIESLYCPSCYVVEGYGTEGSEDRESRMPFVAEMPMLLNDYEMVAVTAYLQAMDTPGDYSKVTARADWERYFNKKLEVGEDKRPKIQPQENLTKTALLDDSPEVMIEKMGCFVCHKVPTIPIANTGLIGPELAMKTKALERINSPEYLRAVELNRAKAVTPKEYILESILDPAAFVVPGYGDGDGMPTDYGRKFTVGGLNKLANFLLSLDENSGKEDTGSESGKASSASKRD
ncbi:MAG: hypothetical protein ACE5F7_09360 [Nitrospiria bacterium]